jgi:hypothetical protein
MSKHETRTFKLREFKGSRLRCLLLTHQPRERVASFLTSITDRAARVTAADTWAPSGFLHPDEAKLGESARFLDEVNRGKITRWWLAEPRKANTPNWDLVSTATVDGRPGLLLVEAKAHAAEFADDRCCATNKANFAQIERALAEATAAWSTHEPGFGLSAQSCYQLSNRLAFAWKLAAMDVPVVLVYLGFLNAAEMEGREVLRDHAHWRTCVVGRSRASVPQAIWDRTFIVDGTPLTVLIRSAEVSIRATLEERG